MSDVGCSLLGAGAWGWPREMLWGGRWEGGSCLGTHVRIKDFKILKIKKLKKKKKKEKKKEMRVLFYYGLFEILPTSDKLWAIIFSAGLIISWKVKWPCEYLVIDHWKLPMNGSSANFWFFSVPGLVTHFSICSSTLDLLRGILAAMANTARNDAFPLVPGHRPW